jgi:hypothetical protein
MIDIRDTLLLKMANAKDGYSGTLNDAELLQFVQWLGPEIQAKYTKPDFRQYDYIQVVPSKFAIIITYSIIIFVNIGAGFFVVYNPWEERRQSAYKRYRYR